MMGWSPRDGEEGVPYDPSAREAYEAGKASPYAPWAWPTELRVGRNTHGCFPEIAVRAHYEQRGYCVLLSEPQYPDEGGFIFLHYRGMRMRGHPAFVRLAARFPDHDLHRVAEIAREAKLAAGLGGGGGDPDLFVYHLETGEQFFVEVKDEDELHANQLVCFPIIEAELAVDVRVARLIIDVESP